MADSKDWSSNANEALQVRLKHADKTKDVQFNPNFTYPIFGDEETIFGYRGLKIRLNYTADTLKPSLEITSHEQYPPLGDTKPDDIEAVLTPLLPSLESPLAASEPRPSDGSATWEPPGELLHQYDVGGRSIGIWSAPLTDPRAKELLRNIQIFVLFFIEGGTCIELDDPDWTMGRWRIFFIYAIDPSPTSPNDFSYSFIGYSTAYTLFFLDKQSIDSVPSKASLEDATPTVDDLDLQTKLPCRSRISQFVILPPYQGSSHGAHLYDTMMDHFLTQPTTHEITVEDPNESFDDLRDYCDLIRLRDVDPAFASLSINSNVSMPGSKSQKLPTASLLSQETINQIQTAAKIAPRQFARLVEMQLLSRIPLRNRQLARLTRKDKATDANDRAYYFWRLLVKQRLYKHNVDQLAQLDLAERVEKLEETLAGLERDYVRILEGTERRAAKIAEAVVASAAVNGKARGALALAASADTATTNGKSGQRLKRRIVDDDDDDDEDDEDDDGVKSNGGSSSSKRARVGA